MRTLAVLRGAGREEPVRRAFVVATDVDGPSGRGLPETLARRLRVEPEQVLHVPFDATLQSPDREPHRLRPAATEAFLRPAELVTRAD
ncbi:hypothetical protein ACWD00_09550 [Streptomyces viridiviolaceus]